MTTNKKITIITLMTAYTVEDISGADVTPYHYEINILPEMIQPFEITSDY